MFNNNVRLQQTLQLVGINSWFNVSFLPWDGIFWLIVPTWMLDNVRSSARAGFFSQEEGFVGSIISSKSSLQVYWSACFSEITRVGFSRCAIIAAQIWPNSVGRSPELVAPRPQSVGTANCSGFRQKSTATCQIRLILTLNGMRRQNLKKAGNG